MRQKVLLPYFVVGFTLIGISYYGLVSFKGKSQLTKDVSVGKDIENSKVKSTNRPKPKPQADLPRKRKKPMQKCKLSSEEKFSTINYFVLFIGYSRSGSTLFGSLLDAHPHAVIANEYSIVKKFPKLSKNQLTREYIFNQLLNNSFYEATRLQRAPKKPGIISFNVPNQWQGRYNCSIKIIGDKKGAGNSHTLSKQINVIKEMKNVLQVPIKFIHVYRNPYDNIATMVLRQSHQRYAAMAKNFKPLKDFQLLKKKKKKYISLLRSTEYIRKKYPNDVFDVDYSRLLENPTEILSSLCKFLKISCSKTYLSACEKIIFKKETFTRDKIVWTNEIKASIVKKIRNIAPYRNFKFDHM